MSLAAFAEDVAQTIAAAYQEMNESGDFWVAISDFSHDWHGHYTSVEERQVLVTEPIALPEEPTLEQRQWAAFCAASVEYLCEKDGVPVPEWTHDPRYNLPEEDAFYTSPVATQKPRVRERLQNEAPDAFKKRHVYCSNRVYASKYDAAPLRIKRSA